MSRFLLFLALVPALAWAADVSPVVTTRQPRVNLALGAQATASTEEKQNPAPHAIDGQQETRWCASGGRPNEWLKVDLGQPKAITGFRVSWESPTATYLHKIEVSDDDAAWRLAADRSTLDTAGPCSSEYKGTARYVRVTFLGQRGRTGGFGSIRELEIFGEALAARDPATAKTLQPLEFPPDHPDARWLSDLKVAPGFDVSIFAHPPMVTYPIFLSVAADGTLFVGCDQNGSIGRDLHHGRILRLRDTDGDGRADQVTEFVPDVDTPRGIVWDHDRLYVLHPPDLSVYIDHRGTGVSDEKRDLVRGIGWTFKDRPGDHASNGVELGIDGWLYCAIGDFGFMHAEGADGRSAQLRGGGVVRVRPDGTGFEIYARGTRNILEAAVSPLLDLFARDNTNDGDGWDTRFHHFTGLENHGYPRLFKNFKSEIVECLADYGGGSATGSCWVDEPGIPAPWNHSLFTCDWGRNFVYQHNLVPNGATFTTDQNEFFGATRVTDADIDAQSRLYVASWKGATFTFNGPDVGYLVRLAPHGYTPAPVPDFDHLRAPELVKLLESPSHRTRLEAQRALLRRDDRRSAAPLLQALAADRAKPLPSRIAALFGLKQMLGAETHPFMAKLAGDETIAAWAIRALTDREDQLAGVPLEPILAGLHFSDARTRREAAVSIARLDQVRNAGALKPLLDDPDPIVAHTAVAALERLHAVDACLAVVDAPGNARARALQVLAEEHTPAVVDAILARLQKSGPHRELLTALCRLYFVEGPWEGGSWGTRPDTRGPYYQPEEWSETKRIGDALLAELNQADADEAKFLSAEFARHRIKPGDATGKLVALAAHDASIVPTLARQFAQQDESAPASAVPLLGQLAHDTSAPVYDRGQAIQALAKVDDPAAIRAAIAGLASLEQDSSHYKDQERTELTKARKAFFTTPKLENEPPLLIELATQPTFESGLTNMRKYAEARIATGGLLKLAGKKFGAPEPRDVSLKALQPMLSKSNSARMVAQAMRMIDDGSEVKLLLPLLESEDVASVKEAADTFKQYKVQPASLKAGAQGNAPLLGAMKTEAILEAIVKTHGEVPRGEQLFTQQGCVACHTTKAEEPLKGPFLGAIAGVYQRRDLAENILLPSKSIAQGFATNHFVLKNGTEVDGFVTTEAAEKVSIRTITSQEMTFTKTDIKARSVSDKSLMPEGLVANLTVKDFASLLDYLESLMKK